MNSHTSIEAIWKISNKVIHLKLNKMTSIDMLKINQKSVTNIEEISNELNYYFPNIII